MRCEARPAGTRCRAKAHVHVVPFGARAYWLCTGCAAIDQVERDWRLAASQPESLAWPDEPIETPRLGA